MGEVMKTVALPVADAWGMHGDVGAGWWIVMIVGMAVFLGAVILAAVWLTRGALSGGRADATETPNDVLQRRFAQGVITAEDYEQRRKLLAEHGATEVDRAEHAHVG